jgi:hypothetical protein
MSDKKDSKPEQKTGEKKNEEPTQEQLDHLMEDVLLNFPFDDYAKIISNIMEVFDDPDARAGFRKYLEREKNK